MHMINSKNEEEKRSGADSRDTFSRKRLSFNKASSEPPSGSKNAVTPIHDVGPDKGGEEIEAFQNRDTRSKIVPPILMSKIESQQQQSNTSNSVMNNYFNIPLS